MFYYAYLDSNNFVVSVHALPSQVTIPQYVEITEEQYNDPNLIGMYWNGTGFEVWVTRYYYALLDSDDVVIEVYEGAEGEAATDVIVIDSLDTTLIGKWYNRNTQEFQEVPIHILAEHSTDEINVGEEDKWLSDELNKINTDINTLETAVQGKAATNHNHSLSDVTGLENAITTLETAVQGKAATGHTHSNYSETTHNHNTAYAGINHDHDTEYADKNHNHDTDYAAASHTHNATDISGLNVYNKTETDAKLNEKLNASAYTAADVLTKIKTVDGANSGLDADTLDGKQASAFANATHTHDYAASNHNHNSAYAPIEHTHSAYLTSSDISGLATKTEVNAGLSEKADADHTHTGFAAENHSHSNYATNATVATLSETVSGKANASHTHAQADVTGLSTALAGKAAASHSHTLDDISETTNKKVMTAAERTKLSGIAAGANNYTHPTSHPASMITGLANVATSGSYNDLTDKPTSMTPAAHTHAQSEITGLATALSGKAAASHSHAQSDITGLADALAGKASTSHTHTAAAVGAAASNHNHDSAYISKDLLFTNDTGGVEFSYGSGSGKNVLTEISNMAQGFHTIYAIAGTAGNPETAESYRFFVHKTSTTIGWIWAFGADGSVYSNYMTGANTFKGWRTIHDTKRKPLWTGSYYMTAGHTATPSKKLSQCEHGWILLWSDYDPDTSTVNNSDFATTMIPNRSWAGGTWNGAAFYCDVPRYSAGTATDSESRVIKVIDVYDNKLVGSAANNAAPRNDVILRAVYEF